MSDEKLKNGNGIGERLRRLRLDNDLTQAEVAQSIGVTQQTYSRYEGSNAKPDSDIIVKLCGLYGVTADYLLGIDGGNSKTSATKLSAISEGDVEVIVEKLYNKLKNDKEEK